MSDDLQLFDALPAHIEEALRASIRRFGVLVPITVDQNGHVLDGNHRKEIAEQEGIPYDRLKRWCDTEEERREIARTLNADRRQLTEEQRRAVVEALAAETVSVRGEQVAKHTPNAIASALGVALDTVQRDMSQLTDVGKLERPDRAIGLDGKVRSTRRPQVLVRNDREQDAAPVLPDMVSRNASLDAKRAARIGREREAEQRRAAPVEATTSTGEVEIRHGDFRHALADLEPGTVDAIITDPPYPREYWPLYGDLGALAARVLTPNGVLAVMIGTRMEMLEDVDASIAEHMRRRHRGVYLTPGQRWRDQVERVATGWKPILIYANPAADDPRWINDDVFTSSGTREADQRFHHWGQSEAGFADLIRGLTEPGHLVVDPFLGGGTTALVCRDLGRRFIGCDLDAAAVTTSRERVA